MDGCTLSCKFPVLFFKSARITLTCPASADIEQEVNGLYSFDRKEKLDSKAVREIQERAQKQYYSKHSS